MDERIHAFLTDLEQFDLKGHDWVSSSKFPNASFQTRQTAVNCGYAEAKGQTNTRQYRITQQGRMALADAERPTVRRFGPPQPDSVGWQGEDLGAVFDQRVELPASWIANDVAQLTTPGLPDDWPEYDENFDHTGVPATVSTVATVKPLPLHTVMGKKGLCLVPGCGQPRHLRYRRCKTHQQAIWRAKSKRTPFTATLTAGKGG